MTPADEQKFLELLDQNRSRILRVCRVYAWAPSDQDDLYQEILCQIWCALPDLREHQFIDTWLYRIAINTAISFARKRGVRTDRVVYVPHDDLTQTIESRQPAAPDSDDRLASLYSAIYTLDPLERALVTLFLEGLTYDQIADATGITPTNVGVMLHRARKKLSALMKEEELT